MPRTGDIRIGISGWLYPGWRGIFYPKDLKQKDELAFAGRTFRTIGINGTFYSLKRPEHFAAWRAQTPDDFKFAVKGSRYITHMLKLTDSETALANFFRSGILRLGEKVGPMLWQFAPRFRFEPEKLSRYFDSLPRDTREAARLAKRHDHRIAGRSCTKADADTAIRHAVEVRHETFKNPEFISLLRKHRIGLVVTDGVGWPLPGCDRRFRLLPPAWLGSALCERIRSTGDPAMGKARRDLGAGWRGAGEQTHKSETGPALYHARGVRVFRQRCQSARTVRCASLEGRR